MYNLPKRQGESSTLFHKQSEADCISTSQNVHSKCSCPEAVIPYCTMEVPNGSSTLGTIPTHIKKYFFFQWTTIKIDKMKARQKVALIFSIWQMGKGSPLRVNAWGGMQQRLEFDLAQVPDQCLLSLISASLCIFWP